ncbi:MAG: NYN domain-containing protein [Vicinamibacterales bacterium]
MAHQERVNIAVFIDFDNIEIGVKTTLGEHFDIGTILEALKERGEVVTKIAYADWTRAGEYSRALTQHAIRLVQRNLTPGGDKNGADINLALDALEMAFTHPHINAYVIVGGDSDFLSLVEKLKQYDKKVFVVGGRSFTSVILQRNCHEFIAYENLMRRPSPRSAGGGRPMASPPASQPVAQAFPIVRRALKILADREVSPQTGLLKSTLLQLDSTFSERSFGASSFLDFTEKLQQAGLVQLKHSGRSVMVELNPAFPAEDAETPAAAAAPTPVSRARADGAEDGTPPADASPEAATPLAAPPPAGHRGPTPGAPAEPLPQIGDNAEGVKAASQLLTAATSARWPMYLRNVKQILRAGGFDERRYGFGGLIELLRACQRDGLVRMERDRRGGLRVFQGPALRGSGAPRVESEGRSREVEQDTLPIDEDDQRAFIQPLEPVRPIEIVDVEEADVIDAQPVSVVDTTAELLGRAKPRKPRARAAAPAAAGNHAPAARGTRKSSGSRKTAGAKRARTKKAADD